MNNITIRDIVSHIKKLNFIDKILKDKLIESITDKFLNIEYKMFLYPNAEFIGKLSKDELRQVTSEAEQLDIQDRCGFITYNDAKVFIIAVPKKEEI